MKQLARWSPWLMGLVLLGVAGQPIATAQESKGKPKENTELLQAKDAQELPRPEIWWGLGGTLGRAFRQQVDRFNESQDRLHVEVRLLAGYDGVKRELDKAFQTGDLPDAAIVEIHQIASLAVDNRIQPLDAFITNDPTFQHHTGSPMEPCHRLHPRARISMHLVAGRGFLSRVSSV